MRRTRSRRAVRRTVRRILLTTLVVGCLLALLGGWLGLRGWQTRGHLENAASLAQDLSQQVLDGETAQARRTLEALQQQTAAARSRTGDVGWRAASSAPYGGPSMSAVRELAAGLDELARRAFPALVELNPRTLLPSQGRLDLATLRGALPSLVEADTAVREVRDRIAGLPSGELVPAVEQAVTRLRVELDRLAAATGVARRAATLLPTLLGADRPRTYLVLFQNLAEPRATGGIFGAFAVVRAEKGEVKLVRQGAATDLNAFKRPVAPLSRQQRALYTDLLGIYPADVNLTPHFPTAARLFREMYLRVVGGTVDGVLATDPVALSYLLKATGPVAVPGYPKLTGPTVVRALLSDTYQRIEKPAQQDRYFAASARAVFDALLKRTLNPQAVAQAVDKAVTERRLLFWSAHPDEQREFVDTRLAGVLPEQETVSNVGVFLNDGSGAKLGYYLHRSAELGVGDCRDDGSRELRLRLTLRSSAPASGLSESVRGLAMSGDPYTIRVLVSVFSPVRGSPLNARLDGRPVPMGGGVERGRQVGVTSVDIGPGRTRVLEVSLLTPPKTSGEVGLWLTPGVTPWTTRVGSAPACGR
ncbi:DUF4012 domain-containing protein [Micromonospora sp. WMMD1102]|uniref:DUF4012 domain-containing protein n=1 Tax=Micromonospora sp. WMMD1102 TaxID=3016105 RepID=UPI0024154D1D|nr:DUF4012 domain-containing protein [Micromonospora sp. WMMD1102]MDG4787389.1 DUF4012 domain-containing protein [Micromonospora sp. WMMD1102]